jgi:hypothetical protein
MSETFHSEMLNCISQFFREVHPKLTPSQDIYPEIFDTDLFFPLQRKTELAEMMREARKVRPRVVMEIGCDKGGGLYHWCMCLQPTISLVIGCEVKGTPYRNIFEEKFRTIDFLWRDRSSYASATVDSVYLALGSEKIDVLFIDGDKTATEKDFTAYLPLMSKRGIVFIHDVCEDGGPQRAFQRIRRQYRSKVIHDTSDYNNLKPLKDGEKPKNSYDGWLRHWQGKGAGVGVVYLGDQQ